jgi:hypothetical protein
VTVIDSIELPIPKDWAPAARRHLLGYARKLAAGESEGSELTLPDSDPGLYAAVCVLADLRNQGWQLTVKNRHVLVYPPTAEYDAHAEKARVRQQEHVKRDEQLQSSSVRRFVLEMERPREFQGGFVSIFDLMRDGRDLADRLAVLEPNSTIDALRQVIDPYVQVFSSNDRCTETGLRLLDIWRYFRHTWSNQYTSTPGRTMMILVRDRASPYHPVIGIAALASPVVQLRERDEWIGWQSEQFVAEISRNPTTRIARWLHARLEESLCELFLDDLLEDGLYWPSLWNAPSEEAIERLSKEADVRRRDHHRFVRRSEFKRKRDPSLPTSWIERAESDLYRSKRCANLAELLRARAALIPHFTPRPDRDGLANALDNRDARRAIANIVKRAKAQSVGTEVADLTVCGAIAPYNALLGGKLVSMLSVSPSVVREYHERYRRYASEIASSLAGRPIRRESRLVFVGTTSLYGSGSSQYNRIRIPSKVLGGTGDVVFRRLGKSRSYGTSHLSARSVSALARYSERTRTGVRVNHIFGEGASPKLRKVRDGLDLLGWPSNDLLQHHRARIVYGVPLVSNLLPYLLGIDSRARYVVPMGNTGDCERVVDWWFERWARSRARSPVVLEAVSQNIASRPPRHGARVQLPEANKEPQLRLNV